MDGTISRAEHEEFAKRIEEENARQNKRLELLEESVRQIGSLAASVDKLATSMNAMVKEQEKQGQRLEKLEGRDGEMWRTAVKYVLTLFVGAVFGFIFKSIGM